MQGSRMEGDDETGRERLKKRWRDISTEIAEREGTRRERECVRERDDN